MKIMVVNVAAEYGGALTILEQFRHEFENDKENQYIVVLSRPRYENTENVKYINFDWVKKSALHRLWFDNIYIRRLIKKEKPNKIISLQNKGINFYGLPQEVYFQNALFISEKKYSLRQSKKLWMYQNILAFLVKRSLRKVEKIYVQAEWIKNELITKWGIVFQKIEVKKPLVQFPILNLKHTIKREKKQLFYPANAALYKNHITLIKACIAIWEEFGINSGLTLTLTGQEEMLSDSCQKLVKGKDYPIKYCGYLSREEMVNEYKTKTLVFPSLIETVGLPLIEASCFNSYILAADLPYAHEALDKYEKVFFFEPENVDNLIQLLKNLMDNKREEKK